jgi:hypothetical protein
MAHWAIESTINPHIPTSISKPTLTTTLPINRLCFPRWYTGPEPCVITKVFVMWRRNVSVTVYLSFTPPSRWRMSCTSFRLPSSPLPFPTASLRGFRQTCDGCHLPLCDPTRRTVLSDSKLWVGFLIFGVGNLFGLFVLGITVQYCVFSFWHFTVRRAFLATECIVRSCLV